MIIYVNKNVELCNRLQCYNTDYISTWNELYKKNEQGIFQIKGLHLLRPNVNSLLLKIDKLRYIVSRS